MAERKSAQKVEQEFSQKPLSNLRKRSWRKIVAIIAFIILNVVVIAMTAANEFGNSETAAELSDVHINGWWLVPALLCFIAATAANVAKYVIMIRRAKMAELTRKKVMTRAEERDTWRTAWRVVMLGKYYDNVTPGAIGGQPFQIYYMHKNSGLKHGDATSIPIVAMIAGQIGFLILAIISFLVGGIGTGQPALMTLAWLGLLFYAFWPLMMVGVNFFPKPTAKFINLFVRILARFKIVKDRDAAVKKVETETLEYVKSVKETLKEKGVFGATIGLAVVYQFFLAALPFFVLTAFGGDVGFWKSFVLTLAVTSAVYFVPTPGNAGAAEGTFYIVFSALSDGYVFWAMLIWRFFSYYIYVATGPLIYLKMHFEKKRLGSAANSGRNSRQKKAKGV